MTDDRYIIIRVAYDRQPGYGRSLEWIAPELKNARLRMTEDHADEASPSRTWAGIVDGPTFERFADAWKLGEETDDPTVGILTEDGYLATRAYTFDGMNWEAGGESPIVYVSLHVGVVRDVHEPDASRMLVHVGS